MAKLNIAKRNRVVGMLQTGMSSRAVARALTHVIQPFCVSGHYFSRQAMFRSDQKLGAEGHDPYTRPVSFLKCS